MGIKIKYYSYLLLLYPIALLPLSFLYKLSDAIYILLYKIMRYRIGIVRQNLKNSFPQATSEELSTYEKEFFHHLCDNIVETIKLLHISTEEINRRVKVDGKEVVEEIAQRHHPVVIYLGHYGNWEWVPAVTQHYSQPKLSAQIYKPLRNRAFECIMLKVRSRFQSISIPQKKAFRTLLQLKRLHSSFVVGFIADHRSNSDRTHHRMRFLHQETTFNVGGEEIGNRIDAEYVYLNVRKTGRGHYQMTFQKMYPLDDGMPYPYTRKYMQLLEQTIQSAPPYWLWSHRRWLYN